MKHVPAQVEKDGDLIDTLVAERYHQVANVGMENIDNTRVIERAALSNTLALHMHTLTSNPHAFKTMNVGKARDQERGRVPEQKPCAYGPLCWRPGCIFSHGITDHERRLRKQVMHGLSAFWAAQNETCQQTPPQVQDSATACSLCCHRGNTPDAMQCVVKALCCVAHLLPG